MNRIDFLHPKVIFTILKKVVVAGAVDASAFYVNYKARIGSGERT